MKVTAKQYALTLLEITEAKEGKNLEESISKFSELLKNNNQINQIDKILYYFQKLYNQKYNIKEANISIAQKIEADELKKIKESLQDLNKDESLDFKVDIKKEIIGGIVLKYGDKIIDASLKTRLNQLKNSLLK
ncbi:MAG TPA: ATP synthase F1 subunit delta [Patescibacteria group bacterium]|nr:ATP synthase F1 subunit delta [Patescibacteria group bacterium]